MTASAPPPPRRKFQGSYREDDEGPRKKHQCPDPRKAYRGSRWAAHEAKDAAAAAVGAVDAEVAAATRDLVKARTDENAAATDRAIAAVATFGRLARDALEKVDFGREPVEIDDDETRRLARLDRLQADAEANALADLDALEACEEAWRRLRTPTPRCRDDDDEMAAHRHEEMMVVAREEARAALDEKLVSVARLAASARRLDAVAVEAAAAQRHLYQAYEAATFSHPPDHARRLVRALSQLS